jgi:hypothetical protein
MIGDDQDVNRRCDHPADDWRRNRSSHPTPRRHPHDGVSDAMTTVTVISFAAASGPTEWSPLHIPL